MVMERRVSKLEGAYEQVDERLRSMERQLEAMRAENAQQFAEQNARFEKQIKEQGARFEKQIKEQGDRFEAHLKDLRVDMTRQFEKMNDKIDANTRENNQRIDRLHRAIIWATGLILTGVVAALVGLSFA